MTNSERRVSLVQRALDPPGEALPDWEIFARVGRALGHREAFPWRTRRRRPRRVRADHRGAAVRPDRHLAHAAASATGPLQWPCPTPEHPGTERLYGARRFATPDGRARLAPTPHTAPADQVTPDFPLVADHRPRRAAVAHDDPHRQVALAAGGRAAPVPRAAPRRRRRLERRREGARALAPRLGRAARCGSATPCRRASRSRRSTGARCTSRPGAGALNSVTSRAVDPISLQPELKACAVRVEPVRRGGARERRAPRW